MCGNIFDCLTPQDIQKVLKQAAGKLNVVLEPGVAEAISEYTIEARKATNILVDAHAMARYRQKNSRRKTVRVTMDDLQEVLQISRLTPYVTRRAETLWGNWTCLRLSCVRICGNHHRDRGCGLPAGETTGDRQVQRVQPGAWPKIRCSMPLLFTGL